MPAVVTVASTALLLAVVMMAYGISGCSCQRIRVEGYYCSELSKTFFRKPLDIEIEEFSTYDVSKQYAVYICGNQCIHPPAIHLADVFARNKEAAEFLSTKLREANDDLTVRDIINVFEEMSKQLTYDVSGDSELMNLMEEKVGRMVDPFWRQFSERRLEEIRNRKQEVLGIILKKPQQPSCRDGIAAYQHPRI